MAAVDLELREVHAGVRVHGVQHITRLEGDGLERCASDVVLVRVAVRPTIAPRASGRQYGANRPENAGTMYTPPLSSTFSASSSTSGADEMMPSWSRSHWIRDPVTAMEPLERVVRRLVAELVADGREQPVLRVDDLLARVEDQEAAGAVGVLALALLERRLTEGRRLLVARMPAIGVSRSREESSAAP